MIELYTAATPNGRKISIALEEMALPYRTHPLRLDRMEQKQPEFLRINPNGRIPAIVDAEAGDFAVFESGAILVYLAEKTGRFLPGDAQGRSLALQWLFFQVGGVGPMQGQAAVFLRYAPERIPYAIERYQRELRRLYEVLDHRLGVAEYLAGDYGIADMATFPWVASHFWVEVPLDGLANLGRWRKAVGERPAVQRGMDVPEPWDGYRRQEELIEMARRMLV